ncbi:hypothetical protein M2459_003713 [Parabacteroides sp. PF5-5]|uniref:porin family protein n=1 Tax=unclassified Parabacteroides TaxID=2649774 RepID=UPI002473D566|nr:MULTISPECIES: porin family protein [unclassified Parabacteroides]MDH6307014.1 hypothetical protein [Parabacteroides sp. PH5-39]MDH6317929.1 hypothetical protein [Parabacteroides sp. PF5-13]MDH6321667.1 hypothetical protein [Parabacteroides sp. PH5-13]MDH6325418.1 hypothetical protein [Parabacteroides sp. PH5-8]MDH6329117.1 hypothetical protein [Parabacteroides sp. PH5-41]
MKKIACLLLLLVSIQATAQKFYFTARAGLNLADKTNTSGNFKPGLNFGASAEYMFSNLFATELGAYYSMQGSRFKFADTDLQHNYILIPLLAKFYVHKGLNVFAGPQLGIKANVNKQAFGSKEYEDKRIENDMVKPTDISAVIGVGYLLANGFFVSANTNIGITNTAKGWLKYKGTNYPTDGDSYKNLVLQFNFGYRF